MVGCGEDRQSGQIAERGREIRLRLPQQDVLGRRGAVEGGAEDQQRVGRRPSAVAPDRLFELGRRLSQVGAYEVEVGDVFVRQLSQPVAQAQQDDVGALGLRREQAVRVQERLQNLTVRREFNVGIELEFVQPETQARQQRVSGEAGGDSNREGRLAVRGVGTRHASCEGREFVQCLHVAGLPRVDEPDSPGATRPSRPESRQQHRRAYRSIGFAAVAAGRSAKTTPGIHGRPCAASLRRPASARRNVRNLLEIQ